MVEGADDYFRSFGLVMVVGLLFGNVFLGSLGIHQKTQTRRTHRKVSSVVLFCSCFFHVFGQKTKTDRKVSSVVLFFVFCCFHVFGQKTKNRWESQF